MPSWASLAPWCFPSNFVVLCLFPKGKVQWIFFILTDLNPGTGTQFINRLCGQLTIMIKCTRFKINVSFFSLGISFINQSLNKRYAYAKEGDVYFKPRRSEEHTSALPS